MIPYPENEIDHIRFVHEQHQGQAAPPEPVRQNDRGEFIEKAKARISQGVTGEQWEFATLLSEACKRLDTQQQEIENLKKTLAYERRLDSSVRNQNARTYAKNKLLTAEKQAQAERIEKLITENITVRQELLTWGGHRPGCQKRYPPFVPIIFELSCACGWVEQRAKIEQALKGKQ